MSHHNLVASSLRAVRLAGVLAGALVLAAAPALAAKATFGVPAQTLALSGNAVVSNGLVDLSATGSSTIHFNMILPPDYRKNSKIRIVLGLSSTTPACQATLFATDLRRARAGRPVNDGLVGFNPAGDSPVTDFASAGRIVEKTFVLILAGTFPGHKPGDSVTVGIRRNAEVAEDDCGLIVIYYVKVNYRTK